MLFQTKPREVEAVVTERETAVTIAFQTNSREVEAGQVRKPCLPDDSVEGSTPKVRSQPEQRSALFQTNSREVEAKGGGEVLKSDTAKLTMGQVSNELGEVEEDLASTFQISDELVRTKEVSSKVTLKSLRRSMGFRSCGFPRTS